jgi:predicted DNA-binding WGR domain protein
MNPLELYRIDPARNMRRFYQIDIQPELFGGFLLLKQWGRIGASGRVIARHYQTEAGAVAAAEKHAATKKLRGYYDARSSPDASKTMRDAHKSTLNDSAITAQAKWDCRISALKL